MSGYTWGTNKWKNDKEEYYFFMQKWNIASIAVVDLESGAYRKSFFNAMGEEDTQIEEEYEQALAFNIEYYIVPEDQEKVYKNINLSQLRENFGKGFHETSLEYKTKGPDGTAFWTENKIYYLIQSGSPVALSIIHNITEQKKTEYNSRLASRYDAILRKTYEESYEINFSKGICRTLYNKNGVEEQTYIGGNIGNLVNVLTGKTVHQEDKERCTALFSFNNMKRLFCNYENVLSEEFRLLCPEKGYTWFKLELVPFNDGSRDQIILAFFMDIDKEKRKEARLKNTLYATYENMSGFATRYEITPVTITMQNASRKFFEFFGTTLEDYQNDAFCDVIKEDKEKVSNYLREKSKNKEAVTTSFRAKKKSGELVWIQIVSTFAGEQNGNPIYHAVLSDITEQKHMEQALELERERYRIALQYSNVIMFEYLIKEDTFFIYGSFSEDRENISEEQYIYNFSETIKENDFVYSSDRDKLIEFLKDESEESIEVRVRPSYGSKDDYVWAVLLKKLFRDDNNVPIKIIGNLKNIQSEKEKEKQLLEGAFKDKLTKLFTQVTGEELIKQYLTQKQESELGALLLVDLDNFRRVNELYGRVFGDTIITEVAELLQSIAKEPHLVIRFSKDIFMVFLKNTTKDETSEMASQIATGIREIYSGESSERPFTCSIGIAYSDDSIEYETLLQYTKSAMRYAKEHGKNQYFTYEKVKELLGMKPEEYYGKIVLNKTIQDVEIDKNEDISSFVFEILEKTKDKTSAVNMVLKHIAKKYKLSYAGIASVQLEQGIFQVLNEWSVKNKFKIKRDSLYYQMEENNIWKDLVENENGYAFYNKEEIEQSKEFAILFKDQPCESAILYQGYEKNQYQSVIIFGVQEKEYSWTQKITQELKELSRVIYSYLHKTKAEEANKAKTDFLSRMSYDIRTPMNSILGMISIAELSIDDREKTLEYLGKIGESSKYLLSLINDILDMSRIESGKIQPINESFCLNELVDELESMTLEQAEQRQIELVYEKNYYDLQLLGDSFHLNQVLINLIGNALKFTNIGGKVKVTIEQKEIKNNQARIYFSVKDTGIGISQEHLHKIFNAFEQVEGHTTKWYGGTGLGLSISSRLVQMLGGKLEVTSKLGVGSEFYFELTFDLSSNKAPVIQREKKKELDLTQYHLQGRRILLAEDNQVNREVIAHILEMLRMEVHQATNGKEALEKLMKSEEFYYDVVLMDVRMPVMNGLEFTKKLRKLKRADSKKLPVLAITEQAFDEDVKRTIESGMTGHLSKPIDTRKMLEMIESVLKQVKTE